MSQHPTPAELEAFVEGGLSPRRSQEVVRHLLRNCASCKTSLSARYRWLTRSSAYDKALEKAFTQGRGYERYLRREELRGRKVAAVLQEGGLEALLASDLPLQDFGTLEALLERSWAIRHEDPREMVNLARHAVEVARRLDPHYHSPERHADQQARAWGELANALRTSDDLNEAERAFGIAFEHLLPGNRRSPPQGQALRSSRLLPRYAATVRAGFRFPGCRIRGIPGAWGSAPRRSFAPHQGCLSPLQRPAGSGD